VVERYSPTTNPLKIKDDVLKLLNYWIIIYMLKKIMYI
jgi:hypothetical protein